MSPLSTSIQEDRCYVLRVSHFSLNRIIDYVGQPSIASGRGHTVSPGGVSPNSSAVKVYLMFMSLSRLIDNYWALAVSGKCLYLSYVCLLMLTYCCALIAMIAYDNILIFGDEVVLVWGRKSASSILLSLNRLVLTANIITNILPVMPYDNGPV